MYSFAVSSNVLPYLNWLCDKDKCYTNSDSQHKADYSATHNHGSVVFPGVCLILHKKMDFIIILCKVFCY